MFSDSSRKRNTYKFGFVKSLLDNVFNGQQKSYGIYFTYEELFGRFAENYWNLVIKYDLRQMRPDGKSMYSKVESILKQAVAENQQIIKKVTTECRKALIRTSVFGDKEAMEKYSHSGRGKNDRR